MRKIPLAVNEHYHVFNRGVDKRDIFLEKSDLERFFKSMSEFNTKEPIGSLYENSFKRPQLGDQVAKLGDKSDMPLVKIICYCLNPNHYHFLLRQVSENGISQFMKRLGGGYSWYFNNKYKRSGSLFQGPYKALHVDTNEYLLHLSAYINLNDQQKPHHNGLSKSSWDEYTSKVANMACDTNIILDQFNNATEYENFARSSLEDIVTRKTILQSFD